MRWPTCGSSTPSTGPPDSSRGRRRWTRPDEAPRLPFYALTAICRLTHTPTVFEVVAEPTRRRILDLLRVEEQPVGDVVRALGLSQPAVSKHLRVLREAGLVDVRVDGQRRLYRVRPEPLQEIDEWLAPYRAA